MRWGEGKAKTIENVLPKSTGNGTFVAGMRKYISSSIPLPSPEEISTSGRAVIEFTGIDQAGPSFEARVFLNNPNAGPDTPMTPENGYAGSFHVYGYGLWPRDSEAGVAAGTKRAPETALLPMRRSIVATEPVLRAAAEGPLSTVTVVPVLPGAKAKQEDDDDALDILTIDEVSIHTEAGEGGA